MALQPRGIRNNNPGNIVWSARNNWQGQLPHDPQIEPRFCVSTRRITAPAHWPSCC